jgi:hypothetical protein
MQGTVVDLETKGRILRAKIGSASDRNVIFDTFIGALLIEWRRVMNCNACKQFLQQYRALCFVGGDGGLIPLVFPTSTTNVQQYFGQSVQAVVALFAGKSVGDEFKLQREQSQTLGFPTKGRCNHLSVTLEHVSTVRALDSFVDLQSRRTVAASTGAASLNTCDTFGGRWYLCDYVIEIVEAVTDGDSRSSFRIISRSSTVMVVKEGLLSMLE